GEEAFSIHRPVEKHGRHKACQCQAAHESDGLPVTMRDCGAATFAFGRPTAKTCQLCRKAAFVDENPTFGLKIILAVNPMLARCLHIGALLLAGMNSLFLCVWPCRSRNFHTAVLTMVTQRSSRNRLVLTAQSCRVDHQSGQDPGELSPGFRGL